MSGCLRYLYLLALLVFAFHALPVASQNTRVIIGIVLSGDSMVIANASIIVRSAEDSQIRAFFISLQNGSFTIPTMKWRAGNYILQVSHIGYQVFQTPVTIGDSGVAPSRFTVLLKPKNDELKEFFVRADPFAAKKNGDTLEYNTRPYLNVNNKKLEDLLRSIKGFNIDANGRIVYNGREIEKILLDGDDLVERNYKLLSKNINARMVDEVQILSNYNNNRLLKDIDKSGKIAINLKLGHDFQDRVSGNIEMGGSFQGRHAADASVSYLSHDIKQLLLIGCNNSGSQTESNMSFDLNAEKEEPLQQKGLTAETGIIKAGYVQLPALENRYVVNNNDFGSTLVNAWKIGKAIKMRLLTGYASTKLNNSDSGYYEIFVPPVTSWTNSVSERSVSVAGKMKGQISLEHDCLKNNTGSYSLFFSNAKEINEFTNISKISIYDTLNEVTRNWPFRLFFTGYEAFKLKNKSVFLIQLQFSHFYDSQQFGSHTLRLMEYFGLDPAFSVNTEKACQVFDKASLTVKMAGKYKGIQFNYGLSAEALRHRSTHRLFIQNTLQPGNALIERHNPVYYMARNYFAFFQLDLIVSKRFSVQTGISEGYGYSYLGSPFETSNRGILNKFFAECHYQLSDFKSITGRYRFGRNQPDPFIFYGKDYLSGDASVLNGATQLANPATSDISLSYQGIDLFNNSQLTLTGAYSHFSQEYNSSYILDRAFIRNCLTPTDNNHFLILNINAEKYFDRVKSKLILSVQFLEMRKNNFVNSRRVSNSSASGFSEVILVSSLNLPVNIEASVKALYSENRLRFDGGQAPRQNQWQYENYAKLKIVFSSKFYLNFKYAVLHFGSGTPFRAMDSHLAFAPGKTWSCSITAHNLLGTKFLVQKSLSQNTVSEYSFRLVEGYILGKLDLNF